MAPCRQFVAPHSVPEFLSSHSEKTSSLLCFLSVDFVLVLAFSDIVHLNFDVVTLVISLLTMLARVHLWTVINYRLNNKLILTCFNNKPNCDYIK